ncbi:ATP-dependent nuclease [Dyadobacter fermentans]|uniref:ATP-dependent nuclease n=1 Tax=Dyadobacter fermentans TaxID=94254 RepID=UPI001CC1839C|nr:AAA family ATPase [Dyadobacter fermentans]MBZ1360543.1 ATP-binding protein [Dyadobacter fermentans]
MKLKSFRIQNYKSIIDSGECRLCETDGITVLAGQNESGKSSILQALRDFERNELSDGCFRDDESVPVISCVFDDLEDDESRIKASGFGDITDGLWAYLKEVGEFRLIKRGGEHNKLIPSLDESLMKRTVELMEDTNAAILRKRDTVKSLSSGEDEEDEKPLYDLEDDIDRIISDLDSLTPYTLFFDDFCDILPDTILISDLKTSKTVKGLAAVRNVEKILATDFSKLDSLSDSKRESSQTGYQETLTADFKEKWKQRIGDENGATVHVRHYRNEKGEPYLAFYIETRKGEFLPVGKRSQGFKWFLSFYLQLKAENEGKRKLIILFDEPGMYLHSKAQVDMIKVFEEISSKNQIVYSTHSPYLIGTDSLHRVRLVLNTPNKGTTVEKITSGKVGGRKDALKPIIDAIGLEVASSFSIAKKDNVILEGISDFYYMQAMKILLDIKGEFAFVPSMGASNAHLLMEICIGWGLNWVIIFDDKGARKDYNKIRDSFFNKDDTDAQKQIYQLPKCDGIEDMFAVSDMKLVNSKAEFSSQNLNSVTVNNYGGKELYARLFLERVSTGEITAEKLSKKAITGFSEVFRFISGAFNHQ